MKIVFPGSFDPITYGHLDLIKRASQLFDEVVVALLTNPNKKSLFSVDERIMFLQQEVQLFSNVTVVAVEHDLTVNVVKKMNAQGILRGLRNVKDFEYEQEIALTNQHLAPQLETIFLMAQPQYSFISSSMVKEVAKFNGDVTKLVTPQVAQALQRKLANECAK